MPKSENSLGDLLNQFSEQKKIKTGLNQKKVESAWTEIMGTWISNETTEIKLRGKCLFLSIQSASLRQELHYSQGQILDRLNEFLGERVIEEVVVR